MAKLEDQLDALRYGLENGFTIIEKKRVDIIKTKEDRGLVFGVKMTIDLSEFNPVERSLIEHKIDGVSKELEIMIETHRYNRIKNNLEREF